jgi:hypothetical protein
MLHQEKSGNPAAWSSRSHLVLSQTPKGLPPGADVMITIFGEILASFKRINVIINILHKIAVF